MKYLSHFFISLVLFFSSCKDTDTVAVADIPLDVSTYDFYKDFSKLDTTKLETELATLKSKYPNYINFYLDTLATGTVALEQGVTNFNGIKYFLSHKDYRSLMDTVEKAFPSTEAITKEVTTTLKLIKHFDSTIDLPSKIYYAVSGLSNMVVLGTQNDVTICLDFYLGPDYDPYYQIQIPDFLSRRFLPKYIPINVAQSIYLDKYPFSALGKDFLSMMLEQGKQQYFLKLVAPQTTEAMRFGFDDNQMKWCIDNEKEIYTFFTTKEMLFEKDIQKVVRYVQDGPFASGMPKESPGNVGSFIGYKIIEAYVKETGTNLHDLLEEKDSQKILKLAKYKP